MTVAEQSVKMLRSLRGSPLTDDRIDNLKGRLAARMIESHSPLACECYHAINQLHRERERRRLESWKVIDYIVIRAVRKLFSLIYRRIEKADYRATSAPTVSTETPKPVQSAEDQDE